MAKPPMKVLVSGGGIAGSCLAYWLARAQPAFDITVVERSPAPRTTGQSIELKGASIKIMMEMGLEEAFRSRLTAEEGTTFLDEAGKPAANFEIGQGPTSPWEILRGDMAELFLQATEKMTQIEYKYGDSIKSIEQSEKKVDVVFNGGLKDTYDLVVAADGSGSKTRSMILDEETLKNSYQFLGQYIAFFSMPSEKDDPNRWLWYNAPKGIALMTRPHRGGLTRGAYACITTPARGIRDPVVEMAIDKGDVAAKEMLHEYLKDAGWQAERILAGMDTAEDFYIARAAIVKLPKWTNGRTLVIGDAAFATFGIGTTLSVHSAFTLAGELSKIQGSEDIPKAVEHYEKTFRPILNAEGDMPSFFPQIGSPQTAWGIWIRNAVLWALSRSGLTWLFEDKDENAVSLPAYNWKDLDM